VVIHSTNYNEHVFAKIFIGSFLIVHHYKRLFDRNTALEQKVVNTGTEMLEKFKDICETIKLGHHHASSSFSSSSRPSLVEKARAFLLILSTYVKVFKEWKLLDEKRVVSRIRYTLEALIDIQHNLGPIDDFESERLHLEYNLRISNLKSALFKFKTGIKVLQELKIPEVQHSSSNTQGYPFMQTDIFRCFPKKMSNEQMAHEILLDPLFQLNDHGSLPYLHPALKTMRDCFHKSLWKCALDDLQEMPPNYEKFIGVLEETLEGITSLAASSEKQEIKLIVDIPSIKNQISQGLFSWKNIQTLLYAIFYVFKKVQAPKRDEENDVIFKEVQAKVEEGFQQVEMQPKALCFAMEKMLGIINCMRMDGSNAKLSLLANVVTQNDLGLTYLREKFDTKLRTHVLDLQRTKRAMDVSVTDFHRHFPHLTVHIKNETNDHAAHMCHILFFTNIFQGPIFKEENIPETLEFDIIRLGTFQRKIHYFSIIVNISAYLMRTLPHDPDFQEVGFSRLFISQLLPI